MEYKLVLAHSFIKLPELVNEEIKRGWKPLGGICMCETTQFDSQKYLQAMIKED